MKIQHVCDGIIELHPDDSFVIEGKLVSFVVVGWIECRYRITVFVQTELALTCIGSMDFGSMYVADERLMQ